MFMRIMPTNRPRLKVLALAAMLGVGSVCAQDDPWYSGIRSNWGPGGNSLGVRGSLPGELSMGGTGPDSLAAHEQFGGYRFTDSLAIEGAQTSYGQNGPACAGEPLAGDIFRPCTGSAWSVAGIATLPFNSGLSLYGRLGLHYWQKAQLDENASAGRRNIDDIGSVLGVGVSYELSRAVTVHAESERYSELFNNGGTGPGTNLGLDASVHSIGLSIKF
ncbi:MAG TPA: outer membrane beta-barrel protein [Burkholderiales bacterium]